MPKYAAGREKVPLRLFLLKLGYSGNRIFKLYLYGETIMEKFLSAVLFINGCFDIVLGVGLIFFLFPMAGLLDYPQLSRPAVFGFGGWGIAAVCLGAGRILSSFDKKNYTLWGFLGLLEGTLLTLFCLFHIRTGTVTFLQAGLPVLIGAGFGFCYAVSFRAWFRRS